jgi:two-component system, cell cycle response regulator
MLSGRNSKEEIKRALKLGADDYVTKPFYVKDVQRRMKRILDQMK